VTILILVGHVGLMGRCMVLREKHEREKPLDRPRRRWKDNIKIYLSEIKWIVEWMMWLWLGTRGGFLRKR
jgi:hypothetical protein